MSTPIGLPIPWLRSLGQAFLPDACTVSRYVETSTSDGVEQAWLPIASGVACRVSPLASAANEGPGPGGAVLLARSEWTVWLPALTDVTERDRLTIAGADRPDGRVFEVNRVGQRSYEVIRECLCALLT